MEILDDILNTVERPSAKAKTTRTKRKWREIEAIKDRYQLKQELMDIDWSLTPDSEELELY